jgi:hypothetical protein
MKLLFGHKPILTAIFMKALNRRSGRPVQEINIVSLLAGRAIAQAVSRRLPTAAVRVQTRVWSCGIL